jgi:hypothetical protein
MSKTQLKRLAEKYQAYKEAKGEPLTLQEFGDLFHELLRRFLNK